MAELEKRFPKSRYRAAAASLALDALIMRQQLGDKAVRRAQIVAAAKRLVSAAENDEFRAKGKFILLETALIEAFGLAPTTTRATMPSPTTTTSATRPADAKKQIAFAKKFVALAGEFPKTGYAPIGLYLAGGLYLNARAEKAAVAAYDRLSRDYPKDPYSLQALMILVQLHTRAGRTKQALVAKRRCVDHFGESDAATKYRADIARAESVGKPFFLRFRSVRGKVVNVTKHRGRTVLVYFYISVLEEELRAWSLEKMSGLAKLAAEKKCIFLAVGADALDDAKKVAAVLKAGKIDTPNLLDPDGRVASQYGVLMVPAVAIVGPDGKLKDIVSAVDIVAAVRKALAAPRPAPATRPGK
jgi:peroxiredoxin